MRAGRYYKPELDVLRFCAFLFVFFVHRLDLAPIDPAKYYWAHHISLVGNYGVPLFFFLSAFLITELLNREQQQFGKISVRSFYIRRMLRIWPLYFTFFFLMVYSLPPRAFSEELSRQKPSWPLLYFRAIGISHFMSGNLIVLIRYGVCL